jgi:hypothetical protein
MKIGDILWGMGILILVYLLIFYWKGSTAFVSVGGKVMTNTIEALQGRSKVGA